MGREREREKERNLTERDEKMSSLFDIVPNNAEAVVRSAYPNLAVISPDGPGIVASMSGFLGIPATGVEHSARDGRWIDRGGDGAGGDAGQWWDGAEVSQATGGAIAVK